MTFDVPVAFARLKCMGIITNCHTWCIEGLLSESTRISACLPASVLERCLMCDVRFNVTEKISTGALACGQGVDYGRGGVCMLVTRSPAFLHFMTLFGPLLYRVQPLGQLLGL
jgi:hypothetical protein